MPASKLAKGGMDLVSGSRSSEITKLADQFCAILKGSVLKILTKLPLKNPKAPSVLYKLVEDVTSPCKSPPI